jgi:osmoprotectant transport system ATP-binding protein
VIRLRSAGKRFGDQVALYPTDLSIAPGKITVLIGPSGCGKSTILRLMDGLLTPSEGAVEFDGRRISSQNVLEIRRRIGFVVQEGGLFAHLTAARNVSLMADYLKRPADESRERLEQLCALARFPREFLGRYPSELSGGQRQRVSLMRALMLSPEVLLLDEPLGALDPLVRASLQEELKDIFHRLAPTVVLVTHDMAEAVFFGDRIVLLKEGRIVQEGTPKEFRERPAEPFVTEFLLAQRSLTW